MTFIRPPLSDLITRTEADIDARLPGADSRLRRSTLAVLARAHGGAIDGLYGALSFYARQLMPDTAEAEYLDRWSSVWGVSRKAAAVASGSVAVTGVVGAIVPAGSELMRVDGALFRTTGQTLIGAAGALLDIEAVSAGAAGVTAKGAQLTFTSPVSGVSAVAVAAAGLGNGADEETDAALLARLLTRIRTPPNGGAASDWVSWALEVPGVTRAWAYSAWMGAGSVGLTFVCDGRANIIPLQADLDAVAAHIEPLRPVTAKPVVFASEPFYLDFLIGLTPDTAATRAAVQAELADLFLREAEPGGTMYVSRLREAVSLAAGEFDHRMHSPAGNVVAPRGSMPMIGEIRWQ